MICEIHSFNLQSLIVTIQVSQQEWAKQLWATCPPSFWRKLFKKQIVEYFLNTTSINY